MEVNKFKSQKGFSPVLLIILIPAVVLFLLFSFSVIKIMVNPQEKQGEQQGGLSVEVATNDPDKVEGNNYIFYYPKGYINNQPNQEPKEILFYSRPDNPYLKEGMGISLFNDKDYKRPLNLTAETCALMAKNIVKNSLNPQNKTINSAEMVEDQRSWGCQIFITTKIGGSLGGGQELQDEIHLHDKYMWYKVGSDDSLYLVEAKYFASLPKEEVDALFVAVDKFSLK